MAQVVSEAALVGSYVGLLAINAAAGSGMLGAKTNGEISSAYPTEVTPRGATFAIWGPIFLLQGGGTALLASTGVAGPYAAAAVRPWLATWAAESVWQCTFWTAPTPSETATNTRKAITLVPSAGFLLAAHAAMMSACAALRKDTAGKRSLLGALLIDLPTGLNAGWLAAASGIGVTLAAQVGPGALRKVATPEGGAALVYGLAGYGAVAAVALAAPHSILVSLGYSAATAWACNGIAKRPAVAPKVKRAAKRGVWISAFGALLSLAVCNGFALKNKK